MSIRHRVAKALASYDPTLSYSHDVVHGADRHTYFVMHDDRAPEAVMHMLRIMLKRKPLIHNGKTAR